LVIGLNIPFGQGRGYTTTDGDVVGKLHGFGHHVRLLRTQMLILQMMYVVAVTSEFGSLRLESMDTAADS
jgi:hypothetical protein